MAKPKKGVLPPQLAAHMFKAKSAKAATAGAKGGKKSTTKAAKKSGK